MPNNDHAAPASSVRPQARPPLPAQAADEVDACGKNLSLAQCTAATVANVAGEFENLQVAHAVAENRSGGVER